MRKTTILILGFLLVLLSSLNSNAIVTLPFSDDFESYTVGSPPPPPWMTLAVPTQVTNDESHSGDKSVRTFGGPFDASTAVADVGEDFPDLIAYEAWFRLNQLGRSAYIGFFEQVGGQAPQYNNIIVHESGKIYFFANSTWNLLEEDFSLGIWHKVTVFLDYSKLKANVYVNDELLGEALQMDGREQSYLGSPVFKLRKIGFGSRIGGYVYIDDFIIFEWEEAIEVPFDIKPGSCPNPLNVKSKGVLPVAILGTEDFEVSQIDPESILLEGVAPLRWSWEDVATPFYPFIGKEDCDEDCTAEGPDGWNDLTLKFDTQEIVEALGEVSDGDCLVIQLTGSLMADFVSTEILGEDVLLIKKKGKK